MILVTSGDFFMDNENGMKRQLIEEVTRLSQRVAELEASETEREKIEKQDIETRRKRNRTSALILAGLPIFFGIFMFIIRRPYFMQFFDPVTRNYGIPLLAVAIVLAAVAYPALRGCFSIIESGRQSLGLFFAILVVTFLIVPSILTLILGPYMMLLLRSSMLSLY
jgi:cation transport ATPase